MRSYSDRIVKANENLKTKLVLAEVFGRDRITADSVGDHFPILYVFSSYAPIADRKSFYDPPFTDIAPAGPSGLFSQSELDELDRMLGDVIGTATPR